MPGLRYLGRGEPGRQEFIPGVPARDLTAEEAEQFRRMIEEHRRHTGRELYGPPVPAATAEAEAAKPAGRAKKEPAEHE